MVAKKSDAETTENVDAENTELVPVLSSESLVAIKTFDDALALLRETYGESSVAVASEVLGDGFKMLAEKDQLIGCAFLAVAWQFTMGDHGEYVIARIITARNEKLVITDGSTGIYQQFADYSKRSGKFNGLYVEQGLRRSDYTYDDNGKEKAASTYYLDVSA